MAGNSTKDKAGVAKMWTHFANRIMIIRIKPDVAGALANFILPPTPEVGIYLRWFPDKLYVFDPRVDGPFPSTRTWDFVNCLVAAGCSPEKEFEVFQGYLGYKHALEFKACFSAVTKLPNIEKMLKDPGGHSKWIETTWKNTPQVITALSFLVLRRLKERKPGAVDFAASAIPIFGLAKPEACAAFLAQAKLIDEQAGDGLSIHDSAEYARFAADYAKLVAN